MTHKTVLKQAVAMILGFVLLTGALMVAAGAAQVSTVTVELRPNVSIVVDGTERTFYNVQGQEVHTIHYNGTHYLPVRAIGELMGKNVNWDNSTLTVTLSGIRTTGPVQGTPDTTTQVQNISVQIRPDFSIVVDGVKRSFTDAQGNAVYPMLHNGTNYLPVRAIGELMGKTVSWNGQTRTITLAAPSTGGSLVTDADSFDQTGATAPTQPTQPTQPVQPTQPSTTITAEEARAAALAHAGLTASQVTFVKQSRLDREDGRLVYEVEFYTASYNEYDYEIDAYTGAVVSFDYDAEDYRRPTSTPSTPNTGNTGNTSTGSYIGEEKAKSIALSAAGFTAGQVSGLRCYLDWDDGRPEYKVEFYRGTMEYDYEVDAYTGTVRERDMDSIYD